MYFWFFYDLGFQVMVTQYISQNVDIKEDQQTQEM